MNSKNKIFLGNILLLVIFALLAGCANKDSASETKGGDSRYSDQYPLQSDSVLTWFVEAKNVLLEHKNMSETVFAKELTKRLGVQIEWIHPPASSGNEQVGIIIASGDLPDIFEANWLKYPGGPQRLIEDDVLVPLNEAVEKWAPNYSQLLAEDPAVRRGMSTDEGMLYGFSFIRGADLLRTFWGPFLRRDILDKYGLAVPKTIDEWDNVLRTVKNGEGGNFVPLQFMYQSGNPNPFVQAFGDTTNGLYVGRDGKVHYGQYEDSYKNYLALFKQWYEDGLFSTEVATWGERPALRESFLNDGILASVSYPGSGIGYYLDTAKSLGKSLDLVSTSYPRINPDDGPRFGQWVPRVDTVAQWAAITTAADDLELATRVLDYGYSDEGNLFYNFGIEGESYVKDPADPELPIKYTDKVLYPENSSTTAMIAEYARANYNGPFIQAEEYILNYYKTQTQKDALFTWYKDNYGSDKVLPQLTFSPAEIDEAAQIQADLETYMNESEAAFITGNRPLSEFEDYRNQLRQIGIDRLLELYNGALVRFNER
ncbi:MAG: extracellular solute-binding protein [Spirochaetota bacterium]